MDEQKISTMRDYIDQIAEKFANGHQVVEIRVSEDHDKFRRKLYGAARRRGLLWRFALTDIGVAVAR